MVPDGTCRLQRRFPDQCLVPSWCHCAGTLLPFRVELGLFNRCSNHASYSALQASPVGSELSQGSLAASGDDALPALEG